MKTKLVRIYAIDWERLKKIKEKHGFANYADTTNYVLQKFPEMILASPDKGTAIAGNSASPTIVDNKQLAPTKNNEFMQIGDVKKNE